MKFYKRLFALTASAAMLLSAGTGSFVSAADENDSKPLPNLIHFEELPEWIPSNYFDALKFSNKYGATHAEGNYVCIVQERSKAEDAYYDIKFSGKSVETSDLLRISEKDFYLKEEDIPEMPDIEKDPEAYFEYMDNYGKFMSDKQKLTADNYFRVVVFTPQAYNVDVTVESGIYVNEEPVVSASYNYTFGRTSNTYVDEQFDVFGFLPDCTEEFKDFRNIYGTVSIHDDYVVYCDEVLYAAGTELEVENSAEDKLKEVMSYTVRTRYPSMMFSPAGGADKVVKVFKAQDKGEVSLKFTKKTSSPVRDYDEVISRKFIISEPDGFKENVEYKISENCDELPDWVPTSFSEAMEFDKQYGATHIEDNYVCCVRRLSGNRDEYEEHITGWDQIKNEDVELRISDRKYTPIIEKTIDQRVDVSYEVEVFRLGPSTLLDILWNKSNSNYSEFKGDKCKYSFVCDADGKVTETDIFGWLPDSVTEARAYKKDKGMISVNDDMVVYCNVVNAGTGYTMAVTWNSIARLNQLVEYTFDTPQLIPLDGGEVAEIRLYKASKPGTATMNFTYGRWLDPDEKKEKTVQSFRFDNDLKAEMISEDKLPPLINGDCNNDGAVGLADYITLKRWLQTGAILGSEENADMNKDGNIDVFDLIAMKKLLLNGNTVYRGLVSEPEPMLVAVYNNFAWGRRQYITVYDENGVSYEMYYSSEKNNPDGDVYNDLIEMDNDEVWYDQIVGVMKNEKARRSNIEDDIVARTRNMSADVSKYLNEKSGKSIGVRLDGGTVSYYLIGSDDDGKPVRMLICTDGDQVYLNNCKEIKEYVKYCSYSDLFMQPVYYKMLEETGIEIN